jgi:serine/threonine-protein kinase
MAVSFDYLKRLGSGHFGEVWHAIDVGLDAECALKLIPREKVINQKNFFQEAQVLKLAEHPNIVKVLDTGEMNDSRIYVKMEYLKNGSLDDEAEGAYVKLSRAKRLMIDILRGLQYAHSKNIVHRDIKPANILIGDAYEGKLSDFGLALPSIDKLDLSSIKKYQYILHLAPEVTSFDKYTFLSDLYACGVTLYRLVNGDSFIQNIPPDEVRERTLVGTFPNRNDYRLFIPRSLRLFINKAMNIDPNKRFQTTEEMRHALERIKVEVDWEERKIPNGLRWITKKDNLFITISLFEGNNKKWNVRFRKGRDLKKLRKYNSISIFHKSFKEAESFAKKLLQSYVNGNA